MVALGSGVVSYERGTPEAPVGAQLGGEECAKKHLVGVGAGGCRECRFLRGWRRPTSTGELRVWRLGFGGWGVGVGVWGLGSGVWGFGFGVERFRWCRHLHVGEGRNDEGRGMDEHMGGGSETVREVEKAAES